MEKQRTGKLEQSSSVGEGSRNLSPALPQKNAHIHKRPDRRSSVGYVRPGGSLRNLR